MLDGFATPESTEFYAQEHSSFHYGELDQSGLLVSQAGFGCYRVGATVVEHRAALRRALLAGANLIDTS